MKSWFKDGSQHLHNRDVSMNTYKHVGDTVFKNLSKEIADTKKNQMKNFKLKSTITKIKVSVDEFNSAVKTEGAVSELKGRTIEKQVMNI